MSRESPSDRLSNRRRATSFGSSLAQRGHELEALVALHLDAAHFVLDENSAQISCEIKAEFAGYNLASPSPLRRQRAGRPLPREVAHPTRFERAACGVIRD